MSYFVSKLRFLLNLCFVSSLLTLSTYSYGWIADDALWGPEIVEQVYGVRGPYGPLAKKASVTKKKQAITKKSTKKSAQKS